MTPDQIIQWAREAELAEPRDDASTLPAVYVDALERFAQLARADERERCERACQNVMGHHPGGTTPWLAAQHCLNSIQALKD